jgi:hypothetical protein
MYMEEIIQKLFGMHYIGEAIGHSARKVKALKNVTFYGDRLTVPSRSINA